VNINTIQELRIAESMFPQKLLRKSQTSGRNG
jgi:hypothetical protein